MDRTTLLQRIRTRLDRCSDDELRVLDVRMDRMDTARAKYGPLDVSNDARDYAREAAEESVDRAFYLDALYIQEQDRKRCEAADRVGVGLAELRDISFDLDPPIDTPAIGRTPALSFDASDTEENG